MADEENEPKSSNEKVDEKEDTSQSEENLSIEKEDQTDEPADDSEEEERSAKLVKNQKKDEKSTKAEKKLKKEEDDDSEEDDDEEELPPGLLELPLEVEGKREKKKVERLSASMIRSPQDKKKVEIEEGSGKKLCDIPYVEHQLNITKAVDLKPLHRVLFLRAGTNNEVKKNIKQFNGFTHSKDSKEHEKRVASLNKMVTAELKAICILLGLERSGTKGQLVDRVMDFLISPEDKGQTVKIKAKKRSKSAGGKTKVTKKKRKSKDAGKKGKASKGDDDSLGDSSEEGEEKEDGEDEEEEEEEDEPEEEEDEDSEYEAPKKKKGKAESKKKAPKKSVKENGKKEKLAIKETKKPAAKKRPVVEDSLSEDSEDEPIAKMKKSPPNNDEIRDLVKKILDGADLEKVTMKTVVKQVNAKYPSFDLSDRKDFIKDTVREIIS